VAALLEWLQVGLRLERQLLSSSCHPYALLGMGMVAVASVASYLSGCVACARLEFGIKLPNLYANKAEHKHAVLFNCIQRSHQNFLENFPQVVCKNMCVYDCYYDSVFGDRFAKFMHSHLPFCLLHSSFPNTIAITIPRMPARTHIGHVHVFHLYHCGPSQHCRIGLDGHCHVPIFICTRIQEFGYRSKVSILFIVSIFPKHWFGICYPCGFEYGPCGPLCRFQEHEQLTGLKFKQQ